MKILTLFAVVTFNLLFGQGSIQSRKAQDILNDIGMSKREAESILKKGGIDLPEIKSSNFDNSKNFNETENQDEIREDVETIIELDKSISQNDSDISNDDMKLDELEIENEDMTELDESIDIVPVIDAEIYFGYDVFTGDPEIFQQSLDNNIDPNYIVGPGDEIIIMLWGETELNNSFIISREGYLFIPNIGQVFVNGLTLAKLEKKLLKLLKKVYSSLDSESGQASSFFDVSLGSLVLRPLRVFALGEIDQPGAYSVKPSTTLFTSLYYFNGPSIDGSLRKVKLIRKEKEIKKIDFYDYLLTGKKIDDIQIQRDDVIFIPPRGKTIRVNGAIGRQAIYELKGKEGLQTLIEIAGGLKTTTYMKRAQIDRILAPDERKKLGMDRTLVDVNLEEIMNSKKEFSLFDGDEITFFEISDMRLNTVIINGAVQRPGLYDLGKGLKLTELINKSDGLLGDAYLEEAHIYRKNIDLSEEYISVNIREIFEMDSLDISLISNDEITIFSKSEMRSFDDLTISGHVLNPGVKPFRKGMTVFDLIFLGGGFENDSHLKDTYYERADLIRLNENDFDRSIKSFRLDSVLVGQGAYDISLKMGDEIVIYSKSDIMGFSEKKVYADGYVKESGEFELFKNMRILDFLFMVGGIEDENHSRNLYYKRADLVRTDSLSGNKSIIKFDINSLINDPKDKNNILMKPDDILRIYSKTMFNEASTVSIQGIVNSPGEYELKNKMTLKDLILEAGGVTENVYRYRAEISRINPMNDNEEKFSDIIVLDLNNDFTIFGGESSKGKNDRLLKPFDFIIIRPDPNFNMQRIVSISGNVYYPGEYVLRGPKEKVTDVIKRAGGLRPEAYALSSKLIRDEQEISLSFDRMIKNPNSRLNFDLIEGDEIIIGGKTNLVVIEGAVSSPGNYQFIKGNRMNDYIKMAGGYLPDAAKYGSFVRYPDGLSKQATFFGISSPRIKDGCVITIPTKEEAVPFSFTEYIESFTRIWADMTQAYLLITLAMRNS